MNFEEQLNALDAHEEENRSMDVEVEGMLHCYLMAELDNTDLRIAEMKERLVKIKADVENVEAELDRLNKVRNGYCRRLTRNLDWFENATGARLD